MAVRTAQNRQLQAPKVRNLNMAGILVSGPAGAGKSQVAREIYANLMVAGVIIDFQSIYAALLMLERNPDTRRYAERSPSEAHILAVVEYLRLAAITVARNNELFIVATNSDGSPVRRAELLQAIGDSAREEIIDPGPDAVKRRLYDVDGILSIQCEQAVARWYGRLP